MRHKYEYMIKEWRGFTLPVMESSLNQLSKKGWELVCVVEERHYFRRKLDDHRFNEDN